MTDPFPPMFTYRIGFIGRKTGSIGEFGPVDINIDGCFHDEHARAMFWEWRERWNSYEVRNITSVTKVDE